MEKSEKHTDNCGRTGRPEVSVPNCKMDCSCWCHKPIDYRLGAKAMISNSVSDDWDETNLLDAEQRAQRGEVWRCSLCERTYDDGRMTFHPVGVSAICLTPESR